MQNLKTFDNAVLKTRRAHTQMKHNSAETTHRNLFGNNDLADGVS